MKKKVLVIGSGGREHTLIWKLAQSPQQPELFAAPGNAGMAGLAKCVELSLADNFVAVKEFIRDNEITLTIVGPEQPLVDGMVDALEAEGMAAFGPVKAGAMLEGSKVFCKEVMEAAGVPTGTYKEFTDSTKALEYIATQSTPIVIKADGLAAGKGVTVALTHDEATAAIQEAMVDKAFGEAGNSVIIEEFLSGEEASILAFTDGKTVLPLDSSQDHKAAYDGDQGPNTGGMGAYSPAPVVTDEVFQFSIDKILQPVVDELNRRGINYQGILYAGLMITEAGPKVIEFNCRFGDPEAQAVLPRMENDLLEVMEMTLAGRLSEVELTWGGGAAVCVVMASGGYPGPYEKGKVITGLDAAEADEKVIVIHAGTALDNGNIVTAGGRVLGVTAWGDDIAEAKARAYEAVGKINFEGKYTRTDISDKALRRLQQ